MKAKKLGSLVAAAVIVVTTGGMTVLAADAPVKPATMDHSGMAGMPGMSMPKTGDADYDFAAMMKEHHQMGLQMAQRELKEGKSAEMKQMAQKIVAAQTKEIAELDTWMAANKPKSSQK
ncbi:MAG: DUF305 domain-containing protein [Pseudomonadota bacterium]